MSAFTKLFGTHSERELKRIYPLVDKVESYRDAMGALSDEELRDKTKEYKERLDIYKVDVDQEEELESAFKIRTIPNLLLCPVNGKPIMKLGTMNKVQLKELIETTLFS